MEASQLSWISCYGADDGLAYAYALGGTPPYTFTWSPNGQQGDTINTLTPGLHTVTVTDAEGCTATDTVTINEPAELHVDIDESQTVLAYCMGVNSASLTASAWGGTPGYSYLWNDNLVVPQTTSTAINLLAGVYVITVTDSRGCIARDTSDIDTITNTMSVVANSIVQYNGGYHVSCFGSSDGQAVAIASGAHAPYMYQWYGPWGFISDNDTIFNLTEGTYSVTVTDTNGCMSNTSILITEPDELSFTTLGSTDESCVGGCNGTVTVDITGGTPPYYHDIDESGIFPFTNLQLIYNDSLVPNLCAGLRSIYITDANNCISSLYPAGNNQQTIGTGPQTTAIINSSTATNVSCAGGNDGSLSVFSPNPNTTNYFYTWENVNNPGVTLATGVQATGLFAGTYVLLAHYTDGGTTGSYTGCISRDTISISEPSSIEISIGTVVDVDCFGNSTGSISASISGGTPNYFYQWNPAGGSGTGTVPVANNVAAGYYTLTVRDNNQCLEVDTFEVDQPPLLGVTIKRLAPGGFDLVIDAIGGGTPPYTYSWQESSSWVHLQGGTTYTVTNYGVYYLIVTDAHGCIDTSNGKIFSPLGLSDEESDFAIYPNPFKYETTLDFGQIITEAEVRIIDVFGKIIEEITIYNTEKYVITNKNKASGVYFIEIEYLNEKMFGKLIIE